MSQRTTYLSGCFLIALSLGLSIGCASGPPVGDQPIKDGVLEIRADWDDLEAAIDVAQEWAEMGLIRAETGERRSVYTFVTVREEPATLVVERLPGGHARLSASVGRAGGDTRAAARLVRAVARRLEQLAGKDVAPVR